MVYKPFNEMSATKLEIPAVWLKMILLVPGAWFASMSPAMAYIDPGTGSALAAAVIGAFAAASYTLRLYWHKFKSLFHRKKPDEQ
jgi:hypothetical protein